MEKYFDYFLSCGENHIQKDLVILKYQFLLYTKLKATQEAECSLRIKDIIGITQTSRAGLGSTSKVVFSKVGPKGKRDMLSEEVRMFEEEQSFANISLMSMKSAAFA